MNICNETEQLRNILAVGVWENEGGAPGRDSLDRQYGRRIEADRSWTVYHVFTGAPAIEHGQAPEIRSTRAPPPARPPRVGKSAA